MKYTKEEKQAYLKKLRDQWKQAKTLLDEEQISAIQAIIKTHGMNISAMGFFFVSLQMKRLELDGLPYLDAKTYKGWKDNGFHVKKGEKSQISGITWINVGGGDDPDIADKDHRGTDDGGYMFPKEYHLFHRTQVDAA